MITSFYAYDTQRNMGGIIDFAFAPVSTVDAIPQAKDFVIEDDVIFLNDADWLSGYGTMGTLVLTVTEQENRNLISYKSVLTGFIPRNVPQNTALFSQMAKERFLVIARDVQNAQRLLGDKENGAQFAWNFSTETIDGSAVSGTRFTFTWQHKEPPPFYQGVLPDGTFIEVIGAGGSAKISVRKNSGPVIGTRKQLNFIEDGNILLTIIDDPAEEEVEIKIRAINLDDASNVIKVSRNSGAVISTRPELNLIEGYRIGIEVEDDGPNNKTNITIRSTNESELLQRSSAITVAQNITFTPLYEMLLTPSMMQQLDAWFKSLHGLANASPAPGTELRIRFVNGSTDVVIYSESFTIGTPPALQHFFRVLQAHIYDGTFLIGNDTPNSAAQPIDLTQDVRLIVEGKVGELPATGPTFYTEDFEDFLTGTVDPDWVVTLVGGAQSFRETANPIAGIVSQGINNNGGALNTNICTIETNTPVIPVGTTLLRFFARNITNGLNGPTANTEPLRVTQDGITKATFSVPNTPTEFVLTLAGAAPSVLGFSVGAVASPVKGTYLLDTISLAPIVAPPTEPYRIELKGAMSQRWRL